MRPADTTRYVPVDYFPVMFHKNREFVLTYCLLSSALLVISAPDFGSPGSVTMAVAIERPSPSVVKFATSVQFGEREDSEQNGRGFAEDAGKYISRPHSESAV